MIDEAEREGVIVGYHTMIDWDKTDREYVTAMIEIKITPQRGRGYDHIAQKIYNYPEVETLYLMSGGFDLMVIYEDKSLRDIANFVNQKIATQEGVLSTTTHFILKKYKANGIMFDMPDADDRQAVIL